MVKQKAIMIVTRQKGDTEGQENAEGPHPTFSERIVVK
jgi:hypothetical protein